MKEVFLYGCEVCGIVKYDDSCHGSVWCTICKGCHVSEFHNRIFIGQGSNLYKESHCYVEKEENDKEKGKANVD